MNMKSLTGSALADARAYSSVGVARLAAASALAGLVWFAITVARTPHADPASPAPERFSATRAMRHVSALAQAPRPIASDANRQARQYIVDRLRALGLDPQVQTATVQKDLVDAFRNTHVTLGVVHNIVARRAGAAPDRATRPALLVAAQYDSGYHSRGASQAAPAAAMLETVRLLQAGPMLENDVLFLFADGEQAGALGTQGFAEQHPWARQVGLVLKFDAAGNAGPLVLYNASGAGAHAIDGWKQAVPLASGASLMPELYRRMREALRIGPLAGLAAPVMQFATIGGAASGSAADTPERLERAVLQQVGEAMSAMVRHFGQEPIPAAAQKAHAWFELPLVGLVHYEANTAWPVARLACLLFVGACFFAAQRSGLELVDLVKGVFGFSVVLLAFLFACWLVRDDVPPLLLGWNPEGLERARHGQLYAAGALGAGFVTGLLRLLERRAGANAAVLGAQLWLIIALVGACAFMPGAAHLLAWPLLATLATYIALQSTRVRALAPGVKLLIVCAGMAPAVLLIVPALGEVFAALAPRGIYMPFALLALVLLVFCSLPLAFFARRYVARSLALLGVAGLVLASPATPAHARYEAVPQPNRLTYYKDMATWRAYWLMPPVPLDSWTKQIFSNLTEPRIHVDAFGWNSDRQWYAPAPRGELAFPHALLLKNAPAPGRHVEFTLESKNSAPRIDLWVWGAKPRRVSIDDRILTDAQALSFGLTLFGMEDRTMRFRFELQGDPSFAIKVEESIPGLPVHLLPPRPADAPPLIPMTGTTIAADTLIFR